MDMLKSNWDYNFS